MWAYTNWVELDFSRPGQPTDNACIEAYKSRFRQECLNQPWFLDIEEAQSKFETWCHEYNWFRTHGSRENLTMQKFLVIASEPGS
jgi:putative transposase